MAGNIANIQPQRERWKRSPPTMATRETSLRSLHWFPTDGITHKLWYVSNTENDLYKRRENHLPLHERPNHSYRYKIKLVDLLRSILSQQRVFPAKISFKTQKKVSPKPEGEDRERADSRSPREYVTIWKEIEFTRILIRFKEEEIAKTEDEMACAEELLMKSKRLVGNKAQYLTKSHADLDRNSCATLQLQRAIDTECRIQKKQMDAELRNLRNGIMNSIGILNDIRTMQALLHEVLNLIILILYRVGYDGRFLGVGGTWNLNEEKNPDAEIVASGVLVGFFIYTLVVLVSYCFGNTEQKRTLVEIMMNFVGTFMFIAVGGTALHYWHGYQSENKEIYVSEERQVGLAVGSLCVLSGAVYLIDTILSFLHFSKQM